MHTEDEDDVIELDRPTEYIPVRRSLRETRRDDDLLDDSPAPRDE